MQLFTRVPPNPDSLSFPLSFLPFQPPCRAPYCTTRRALPWGYRRIPSARHLRPLRLDLGRSPASQYQGNGSCRKPRRTPPLGRRICQPGAGRGLRAPPTGHEGRRRSVPCQGPQTSCSCENRASSGRAHEQFGARPRRTSTSLPSVDLSPWQTTRKTVQEGENPSPSTAEKEEVPCPASSGGQTWSRKAKPLRKEREKNPWIRRNRERIKVSGVPGAPADD